MELKVSVRSTGKCTVLMGEVVCFVLFPNIGLTSSTLRLQRLLADRWLLRLIERMHIFIHNRLHLQRLCSELEAFFLFKDLFRNIFNWILSFMPIISERFFKIGLWNLYSCLSYVRAHVINIRTIWEVKAVFGIVSWIYKILHWRTAKRILQIMSNFYY